MIDYTKQYLNGMTSMMLLNNQKVTDLDIKNLVKLWNEEAQPLIKNLSERYNIDPTLLYFK